jgi:hypothetical protein
MSGVKPRLPYVLSLRGRGELYLLEQLMVPQLVKKFSRALWDPKLISVFARGRHWSLSWARSIQFTNSHPVSAPKRPYFGFFNSSLPFHSPAIHAICQNERWWDLFECWAFVTNTNVQFMMKEKRTECTFQRRLYIWPCSGTMIKVTLTVPWGHIDPIKKNQIKSQFITIFFSPNTILQHVLFSHIDRHDIA